MAVRASNDLREGVMEALEVAEDGLNNMLRQIEAGKAGTVVESEYRLIKQYKGSVAWIRHSVADLTSSQPVVTSQSKMKGGNGHMRRRNKAA